MALIEGYCKGEKASIDGNSDGLYHVCIGGLIILVKGEIILKYSYLGNNIDKEIKVFCDILL